MFQFRRFPAYSYFIQSMLHAHSCVRVSPFGYLRIDAHLQLPAAFRSLSRPSSAPSAKAFSLCSFSLDLSFVPSWSQFARHGSRHALLLAPLQVRYELYEFSSCFFTLMAKLYLPFLLSLKTLLDSSPLFNFQGAFFSSFHFKPFSGPWWA